MEGCGSPQDELGGFEFDFAGDIDPVLWDELDSGQNPGASVSDTLVVLRCVDETHPADCTRCTPCPPPELGHKYELVGEEGQVRAPSLLPSLVYVPNSPHRSLSLRTDPRPRRKTG